MKNALPVLALVAALWLAQASVQAAPITIGDDHTNNGSINGWQSIMAISRNDTYTNNTGKTQKIEPGDFNFFVNTNRGRVTPFLVTVDSNTGTVADFTIKAIGTTRESGTDYNATGATSLPFSDAAVSFELGPGETLAPAFLDASVAGVSNGSVIPYNGGDSVFLTGGDTDAKSGDLLAGVGGSPTAGADTLTLGRNYSFNIDFEIAIPEPTTALLGVVGMCSGLIVTRRRRPT